MLALLERALGLSGLLLVACTWRLWAPQQVFPQVPLFGGSYSLGPWPQWIAASTMVAGLAAALFAPRRFVPASLLIFAASTAALVIVDQHRLQPWAYQYAVVAIVLALADAARVIAMLRLLIISFYFHSALTKLDYSFLHTLGQQFLSALADRLRSVDRSMERERAAVGGRGLSGRRAGDRRWACALGELAAVFFATLLLHVLLLVILGPLGLDHKPSGADLERLFPFPERGLVLVLGRSLAGRAGC